MRTRIREWKGKDIEVIVQIKSEDRDLIEKIYGRLARLLDQDLVFLEQIPKKKCCGDNS